MGSLRRRIRWAGFCLLTGVLFQTTGTSCSDLAADAATTLTASIANAFIRNSVYEVFGLDSSTNLSGSAI
jgi:hypothetical protein